MYNTSMETYFVHAQYTKVDDKDLLPIHLGRSTNFHKFIHRHVLIGLTHFRSYYHVLKTFVNFDSKSPK